MTSKMKWTRTPGRKAGPGNLLNDRYEVSGTHRYWRVIDRQDGTRYPLGGEDYYFPSMKAAREVAEVLAFGEDTE
jgi:hypothetical protein